MCFCRTALCVHQPADKTDGPLSTFRRLVTDLTCLISICIAVFDFCRDIVSHDRQTPGHACGPRLWFYEIADLGESWLMLMLMLMHSISPRANLVTKLRRLHHEGCLQ